MSLRAKALLPKQSNLLLGKRGLPPRVLVAVLQTTQLAMTELVR